MDRELFEEYYRQIYQDLYRFALYSLGRIEDAEDVVSEAVMDAYQGLHRLREVQSFRPWMFKILSIKCKRKLREYVDKTVEWNENIMDPTLFKNWNVDESHDLCNAFFRLSGQERMIISMSVFGGYNSNEIGLNLKMKSTTVRSKLARALEKMKKMLEI